MSLSGTVWTPIGPSPIAQGSSPVSGLVSAIAINPSNPNLIYIGTAGGGVWRTDDGGTSWAPVFDRQLALGIGEPGALAIDPNNTDIIYAGTSQRVSAQPQAGLFKSVDGGSSWVRLGSGYPAGNVGNATQFVSLWINVVIVDPADSNIVYLASTGGCFRSTDGGLNWTQGVGSGGDARSLVLDPSTPAGSRVLYAGINGRGIFRSSDGGRNWNQILSGTTPVVSTAIGASPAGFGKSIVAIAPATSPPNAAGVQVIYATLQGTGGAPDPVGLFLSTDQGATWSQRTATGMPTGTQGGYSFHFAVDPASPGDGANDIIFFGAVGHARSTNSGNSFTAFSGVHADNHAWAFVPQPSPTPSIVYCGNDGGLYRSTDGVNWTALSSGGLQTALFYNIDMNAAGTNNLGALQDNGTQTNAGATSLGWAAGQGGDGWDVVYDGTTAGQAYCTSGFWFPAPCTRIWRSTDNGATFPTDITPWGTTSDAGCYLSPLATDPSAAGIVYASGNQNLWQSRDGGNNWRILSPFATTGDIDVAPTNGNNVVIGVANRVFVSTNALAATVGAPSGVTFSDITRNLPPRNVARVAFDPIDPTTIYAVMGGLNGGVGNIGHVFRTTLSAAAWTDISPLLNIPFNALALDGADNPTTIYAGTDFGVVRSVDGGSSWTILDDIHFPRVPVFDLVLRNGILHAATYGRGAFAFIKPQGPSIAVNLEQDLAFGTVCGGPQYLTLEIFNVGMSDLTITSVQRLMGSVSFSVLGTPGTPLVIAPGEHVDFTIKYDPSTASGLETATIRIASNDPSAPVVDLSATGIRGTPAMVTAVADSGNFGNVCLGSLVDKELTINNRGTCPLLIINMSSSSAEFLAPSVVSFPLLVSSGASLTLPIRFEPTSLGAKSATIKILSNDPGGIRQVGVSGMAPAPRLNLMIANAGNFGNVCVGSFADKPLTVFNNGGCTLSISSIASSGSDFIVPSIATFPITLAASGSIELPIRFEPTSFGAKSTTIDIGSDDPSGPKSISLSGFAPSGKITITGSTCFGGVKACCRAERTIAICNIGDCKLHVTSVAFKRKSKHWRLINNPFPATLHPGSCLNVLIRYKATEKCPKCCELVITSDDPVNPVITMDVLAHTIWNDCGCRKDCEDCRKGCCDRHHDDCSCGECMDDCCDEEEDWRGEDHDDRDD